MSLQEADLLGVPSTTSDASRQQSSAPDLRPKKRAPEGESGRPIHQSGYEMRKAMMLTSELREVLTNLGHPWNKHFYADMHTLQSLQTKLEQLCGSKKQV